jgi:predicted transcriptional regulator
VKLLESNLNRELSICEVLHSFSHEIRFSIIDLLINENLAIDEIAERTGIPRQNIQSHIRILFNAGVISKKRIGLKLQYSVNGEMLQRLSDWFMEVSHSCQKENQ